MLCKSIDVSVSTTVYAAIRPLCAAGAFAAEEGGTTGCHTQVVLHHFRIRYATSGDILGGTEWREEGREWREREGGREREREGGREWKEGGREWRESEGGRGSEEREGVLYVLL